eukprot:5456981-Amphidinium_carterae.1
MTWDRSGGGRGPAQTRSTPTRLEIESCLARWAARRNATRSHVPSVHSPWPLGLLIVGGPLALLFACWRCSRKPCGRAKHTLQIELPEGSQPLVQLVQHSEYLSLSTVQEGQYVRVTTTGETLRASCKRAKLLHLGRVKCQGEIGLVLQLEEIDDLAWVAFNTRRCQGWFPLACLQDAGKKLCHCSLLPQPDLEDLNEIDMIGLPEQVPSTMGS